MYSATSHDDEDYLYSPYTMSFRKNDIYSINARNMFNQGLGDDVSNLSQDIPVQSHVSVAP